MPLLSAKIAAALQRSFGSTWKRRATPNNTSTRRWNNSGSARSNCAMARKNAALKTNAMTRAPQLTEAKQN
jgi:hypothetical protein